MATEGTSGSDIAIRAVLALAIVGLAIALFYVTVIPAQRVAAAERETTLTRERMNDVRTALIAYRDSNLAYPSTLDSLVLFARQDSALQAQMAAIEERMQRPMVDSLPFSPRTGARFQYQIVRDSSGTDVYWLGDPDVVGDSIGSRIPNPALRNAASWE